MSGLSFSLLGCELTKIHRIHRTHTFSCDDLFEDLAIVLLAMLRRSHRKAFSSPLLSVAMDSRLLCRCACVSFYIYTRLHIYIPCGTMLRGRPVSIRARSVYLHSFSPSRSLPFSLSANESAIASAEKRLPRPR
jgi:hypothetical protein